MSLVKEIDGYKFETELLDAELAIEKMVYATKTIASPVISIFLEAQGAIKDVLGEAEDKFIEVSDLLLKAEFNDEMSMHVQKLMDNIDPKELVEFMTGCNPNGCTGGIFQNTKIFDIHDTKFRMLHFNEDFRGKTSIAYRLMWWVVMENYKDFFMIFQKNQTGTNL